ncbi:MAG: hypothetical protein Q9219_006850 [cf. Caloplaca sp. 3 TL-2023]
MKTPYYTGDFMIAQHSDAQDDDQLRERMLEHRLANRDDVRDIYVVTAAPFNDRPGSSIASGLVETASKKSKNDLSWAMHWALQVGDQFFELQRGYPDPMRTGLRRSTWDREKQSRIIKRYRQGVTAMSDDEIKAVGESHFSRLERIDINLYGVWCNNCQVAVDHMLRDIGGLLYYRSKLESLHEMVSQFFYNSVLSITKMYGRYRGWNEELIDKHAGVLYHAIQIMTTRSKYPKRHWIQRDIEAAEGVSKKVSTIGDHWFLSVLESSLSLRKDSEELYVRRGASGKPELNFDAVREATKGIFDDNEKDGRIAWLKAMPWLTGGFALGTTRWAAAILSIACQQMSRLYQDHVGLKGGLEESLVGLGFSPNPEDASLKSSTAARPRTRRTDTTGPRKVRSKTKSIDKKLTARYERCLTESGVPYFLDHVHGTRTWEAPDQQEMCLKIKDLPLSRRWQERQEEGQVVYVNQITGEKTETRPGPTEIWAVKKKVKPDWVKSTFMAMPHGWEMRRTGDGERFYIDHNNEPPSSTPIHPMRQEIEDERRKLLPDWNVEWDDDRGKKYRNIRSGDIRWKAVDGPRYVPSGDRSKITLTSPQDNFIEPLPPGWSIFVRSDERKIYWNGKTGRDRVERTTHPLTDKRRRLLPEWEMRYTPDKKRYWVHFGRDGRGTSWWARNKRLKNTSLKNNASGWKLDRNGGDWEWFEGGDVRHSEIPVLDLDDPAEIEFREYPFIFSPQITNGDGSFIEPLPAGWVRRTRDDASAYYWNYKDEVCSEQHPNEEERRNLPALWEMRYTQHGRQYFIDHADGSTWWTHPREEKHVQKLRARPGQNQDGWKKAIDGKSWERFEEHPDAQHTEENVDLSTATHFQESEQPAGEQSPETWRSLAFTREWLKSTNSSEAIAKVISRIPKTPRLSKKHRSSPSIDSIFEKSTQGSVTDEDLVEDLARVETPLIMTEEPQPMEEEPEVGDEPQPIIDQPDSVEDPSSEQSSLKAQMKANWARTKDPRKRLAAIGRSSSFGSNLLKNLQEASKAAKSEAEEEEEEAQAGNPNVGTKEAGRKSLRPSLPQKEALMNSWAKRPTSFSALKKGRGKKDGGGVGEGGEEGEVVVDGLGISGAERVDSGVGMGGTALVEEGGEVGG